MSREKVLRRRYWIVGVLCSLFIHGAIIFLPLHFTQGWHNASPSLAISLIERARAEAVREATTEKTVKTEADETKSSRKNIPLPTTPPVRPPLEEEHELSTVTAASEQKPVPLLELSERDERVGSLLSEIADALDAGKSSLGSESAARDEPQEGVSSQEAPGSFSAVLQAESEREEVSPPETTNAATTVALSAPFAAGTAAVPAETGSPGANASSAASSDGDMPTSARPPAAVSAKAHRQYFASPRDLFAQARNVAASSSLKSGRSAPSAPIPSSSNSGSDGGPAASDENLYPPSAHLAELEAEKRILYKRMNYSKIAAPGVLQTQPEEETTAMAESAAPGVQGGLATRQGGGGAVQEDHEEEYAEGAAVPPPAIQPSAPGIVDHADNFAGPPAVEKEPAEMVAEQSPLPSPGVGKESTASAAQAGSQGAAQDAAALPVSRVPQFDTPETLSRLIVAALSAQKEYPLAALRRKTEGVVKLSLVVAPNGSLVKTKIQTPSGSSILDEAALKLVQRIFPLNVKLPSEVSLVVPIEYRIPK